MYTTCRYTAQKFVSITLVLSGVYGRWSCFIKCSMFVWSRTEQVHKSVTVQVTGDPHQQIRTSSILMKHSRTVLSDHFIQRPWKQWRWNLISWLRKHRQCVCSSQPRSQYDQILNLMFRIWWYCSGSRSFTRPARPKCSSLPVHSQRNTPPDVDVGRFLNLHKYHNTDLF